MSAMLRVGGQVASDPLQERLPTSAAGARRMPTVSAAAGWVGGGRKTTGGAPALSSAKLVLPGGLPPPELRGDLPKLPATWYA